MGGKGKKEGWDHGKRRGEEKGEEGGREGTPCVSLNFLMTKSPINTPHNIHVQDLSKIEVTECEPCGITLFVIAGLL